MNGMSAIETASVARPVFPPGTDLEAEIRRLKKERNAVVLAHYYQESEIQDLADFVGDSLELARRGEGDEGAGDRVRRRALHGRDGEDPQAGENRRRAGSRRGLLARGRLPRRPLRRVAREVPGPHRRQLHQLLGRRKGALARHLHLVERGDDPQADPGDPDRLRARPPPRPRGSRRRWAARSSMWPGTCIVHEKFSEQKLLELEVRHPDAEVIAHPECEPRRPRHAGFVGSTTGAAGVRRDDPEAGLHRRDRGGHPPPDAARPRRKGADSRRPRTRIAPATRART